MNGTDIVRFSRGTKNCIPDFTTGLETETEVVTGHNTGNKSLIHAKLRSYTDPPALDWDNEKTSDGVQVPTCTSCWMRPSTRVASSSMAHSARAAASEAAGGDASPGPGRVPPPCCCGAPPAAAPLGSPSRGDGGSGSPASPSAARALASSTYRSICCSPRAIRSQVQLLRLS